MRCFSIAFDKDSGYDESSEFSKDNQSIVAPLTHLAAIADETARWLDVGLYKKHMNEGELAKYFEDAIYHIDYHSGELNFVGKFAFSELTRDKGIKVVLTGEGLRRDLWRL
jgi:asparagine synthase (glutamine-hydrolysing)